MNFNLKKMTATFALPVLLMGCSALEPTQQVTEVQIKHHKWELVSINDNAIVVADYHRAPYLDIGEKLTITGHSGCNNYFGQASLQQNKFKVENLGSTMKMCSEIEVQTELLMTKTLMESSDISLDDKTLTLKGPENTLVFVLKDWVY